MESETTTPEPMRPLPALLLALLLTAAALCLWVPVLFLLMIAMGPGDMAAAAFLELGMVTCPIGVILLIVYAALGKPWKRPFQHTWFFWLQVLGVAVIGMGVGSSFLHDWQDQRRQANTQEEAERSMEPQRLMRAALSHDDDASFAKAYKLCGMYCPEGTWLDEAIAAHAPRIVGVLLDGMVKRVYDDRLGRAENMSICKRGASYEGYFSMAGKVGVSGDIAIIERFLPLWDQDDVQEAFNGAAFGNHVDAMRALVAHGADLHRPMDDDHPFDNVSSSAMRSGSVDALRWLGEQGVRISGEKGQHEIWTVFDEWVEHSPSAVWTGQLEAMLDALAKLGTGPADDQSSSLRRAARVGDAVLAHVLLRHGAEAKNIDDEDTQAALQSLLKGPPDQLGSDDGSRVQACLDD